MKFVYFGDMHERPDKPLNRTDDYEKAIDLKREEIIKIGKKEKIKAFLQPGDFLHKPKFSPDFLTKLVAKWSMVDMNEALADYMVSRDVETLNKKFENWTPIIGAVGNHELIGESLKSYPKTSLAFLEKVGFMHLASKDKPIIFEEDGFTVAITATSYDIGMDKPERIDDYIVDKKLGDIHIHIVHGFLTNKDMGNMFPHTVLDKIAKKTKADLTISGHDHIGFPLTEVDGKYFCNPGAIPRMKNDKKEMRRKPKVLVIEATKEKGLKVKTVYLKSAAEGKDVLSREAIENKHNLKNKMEEIKSIVNKTNIKKSDTIKEVIREIATNTNIDKDIQEKALKLVSEKMNAITTVRSKINPYKITKIVLENFQSHIHTVINLSDGLNVFVGKSGAGKSAIIRAVDFVFENAGRNARRYIHHGKDFAKVSIYLDNGIIISRVVEAKQSGKNGYEIFNPQTGTVDEYNTKSLDVVQELLGFTKLDIDIDKPIPLNFLKQGEGWFYIGDGYTPSSRAKIIGTVYQTHFIDAVIKDLESKSDKTKVLKRDRDEKLKNINESLEQFKNLEKDKKELEQLKHKIAQLKALEDKKLLLKQKMAMLNHIKTQMKMKEQVLLSLRNLDKAVTLYNQLMTVRDKQLQLMAKIQKGKNLLNRIHKKERQIEDLKKVDTAIQEFELLQELNNKRVSIHEDLMRYQEISKKEKVLNERIQINVHKLEKLMKIEDVREKYEHLLEIINKKEWLAEKLRERAILLKKGLYLNKEQKKLEEKCLQQMKAYEQMLSSLGNCPVCHSQLDKERITTIIKEYQY